MIQKCVETFIRPVFIIGSWEHPCLILSNCLIMSVLNLWNWNSVSCTAIKDKKSESSDIIVMSEHQVLRLVDTQQTHN